jgi:hypothetical protein
MTNLKTIFVIVLLLSSILSAQEPGQSQRDYVKKQVQYDRWPDILDPKPEVRYGEFRLDSAMVSPWRIQRVQDIGTADRGSTVQYVLAKAGNPREAQEILLVSVTRCSTRAIAAEGLIDHLLGIQRPDFKLVEADTLMIGDLAVNFPGTPEPGVFFFRGNILISVKNAGPKAAADLRDLAQALDENLKKARR